MPGCCSRASCSPTRSRRTPQSGWPPTAEDLLHSGRERHLPRGLLPSLLVLALGGYAADSAIRDRQLSAVRDRCAAAESTARYADGRIRAVIAYASPQLDAAGTPPDVRRDLERLVSETAGGQVPALSRARDRVASAPAWRAPARTARRACLSYLDLRRDVLRRGAVDVAELRTPHPEVDRARRAAFSR